MGFVLRKVQEGKIKETVFSPLEEAELVWIFEVSAEGKDKNVDSTLPSEWSVSSHSY